MNMLKNNMFQNETNILQTRTNNAHDTYSSDAYVTFKQSNDTNKEYTKLNITSQSEVNSIHFLFWWNHNEKKDKSRMKCSSLLFCYVGRSVDQKDDFAESLKVLQHTFSLLPHAPAFDSSEQTAE